MNGQMKDAAVSNIYPHRPFDCYGSLDPRSNPPVTEARLFVHFASHSEVPLCTPHTDVVHVY